MKLYRLTGWLKWNKKNLYELITNLNYYVKLWIFNFTNMSKLTLLKRKSMRLKEFYYFTINKWKSFIIHSVVEWRKRRIFSTCKYVNYKLMRWLNVHIINLLLKHNDTMHNIIMHANLCIIYNYVSLFIS